MLVRGYARPDDNVASELVRLVLHMQHVLAEDGAVSLFDAVGRLLVKVVLDRCTIVRLYVPVVVKWRGQCV